MLATIQTNWVKLNSASATLAAGVSTAVTGYVLATNIAYASATAAQNPAFWPTTIDYDVPYEANGALLCFVLKHGTSANDKTAAAVLWSQHKNGPSVPLAQFSAITGGTATVTKDPYDGSTLGNYHAYADTLVESGGIGNVVVYNLTNYVAIARLDLRGAAKLFMDFDTNAGGGTEATDVIAYIKYF